MFVRSLATQPATTTRPTVLVALFNNTTGDDNTANGFDALVSNTTGSNNTATVVRSCNATVLAKLVHSHGNNNIDIGNAGVAGEANTIRIGTQGTQTQTFIAGISRCQLCQWRRQLSSDANGQLGTSRLLGAFQGRIKPMDKASEAILALKPVTFRYKQELDPEGIPQFGLVAEEVEKVNPDLVARDDEGKPYTVRYEAVNAMLLNEFLKEHRKVEEQ